jgi:hypothetical protein
LPSPGNLNREYGHYPAYYRDPRVASHYSIEAWIDGGWEVLKQVAANYQSFCRHRLDAAVTTDRLRVVISRTHGEAQAGITEIRCYE